MIVRASKLLLRSLLLLVAVALLAAGLFGWLLLRGPVTVAWLTPHLERELSTDRALVDIDATQLHLSEDRTLDLRAVGVHVRAPDGRLLAELPAVEIGLSTPAMLLEGRIAVRRMDATAPSLTLTRRADGSIGLHEHPDQADADQFDLGPAIVGFLDSLGRSRQTSYLQHISISGGGLVLQDQALDRTLRARDAELSITVVDNQVAAELGFRVEQSAAAGLIHLAATYAAAQEWISVDVAFRHVVPAELADFAPDLPLAGLRIPLTGHAQGAVSMAGALAPVVFAVGAEAGTVEVPRLGLGELPIEALWVQGTLAGDRAGVAVDRLSLTSDGAHLSGRGEVTWRGEEPTLHADLEAEQVTIDHVARFWPPGEAREARSWVIENIADGMVPKARAQLRFGPGDLGRKPLPEHTLAGEFAFENLTLEFVDTMPPLVGVGGTATFTGQSMEFKVASGHVDDLIVNEGSVGITGIGIKGRDTTQLEIAAEISGPLDQALTLIDRPPLGFASRIGIAPADASGHVVTDLRIGMPLHRDFQPSEIRVGAKATITEGAVAAEAFDVSDAQLQITVDGETVDLAGDAVLEGVPVTLEVRENLGEGGLDRRYRVTGSPDASVLRALGPDLPFEVAGQLGLDATVTEAPGGRTVEVALDLTPTAIQVPRLNWQKAPGAPGTLSATATIPADGPLQVSEFALASDDLRAEGSLEAQIEPFHLGRLRLDRVHFGDTRASIVVRAAEPKGYRTHIDAQTLDLRPWFGEGELKRDQETRTTQLELPWRLSLQADRVLMDTAVITQVDAELTRGAYGWQTVDLHGRLPNGGEVVLTLMPEGEQQRLRLTSTDAGNLLQALDQTSRIEGGELELNARIARQQPTLEAEGDVVARDFHVLDAPILARLLTVASLEGIGNLLGGEGIAFEQLEVPFALRNELLQLGRSRVHGSQLGLTLQGWVNLATDTLDLQGTILPLYGVNWTIGQIPILGQLLRGSEGEGAFALTYGMRGPVDDPTITVNPLSALAPGFLRELFSGLREGTLEPPDMPSHDR